MIDTLANMPGLSEQPAPGTEECDQLERELVFALGCIDLDDSKEGRQGAARQVLRFMVSRGYWPLGTQCRVTKKFKVKTVFPRAAK